jgi:spore coat polysaccharide biosynthesis predicted glycosyltransferase SpsG
VNVSTENVPQSPVGLAVGLIVDAGPRVGYGHAVRCLRLARALKTGVEIFALSEDCRAFFEANGFKGQVRQAQADAFPGLVVTDLRESHGITASIRSQGAVHVSIHDLGLAQCRSSVAIDGSVVQLFPFAEDKKRVLFLGPSYMITRSPVARSKTRDTVIVTLGGGTSAQASKELAEELKPLGLRTVATGGFGSAAMTSEAELEDAMSRCLFAISASGTALYDLLASGIPTIAVALDRLQLRTADAFHELGAVLSAGLLERITHVDLMARCHELIGNYPLTSRMVAIGRKSVDGRGLSRVVGIVEHLRREVWSMKQAKTFTAC